MEGVLWAGLIKHGWVQRDEKDLRSGWVWKG